MQGRRFMAWTIAAARLVHHQQRRSVEVAAVTQESHQDFIVAHLGVYAFLVGIVDRVSTSEATP